MTLDQAQGLPTGGSTRGSPDVLDTLLYAALATSTLVPIWRSAGWPLSHEGFAFSQRTYVYARHLAGLDFLPIWSSLDASGFGSPMPLVYHKLFYFLAGALALVTPSLKAADAIAIIILLVVGALGLARTMRALGSSRLAATIGGCCLITANYTVTNWLVRGALAEFCGAMIEPWIFFFLVRTLRSGRIDVGFGITFGLLWLAHSVLAYFTGLILVATYLALAIFRMAAWPPVKPASVGPATLAFFILVTPYLAALAVLGRNYEFARILTPPYRPAFQFRPFLAYLWDDRWHFGTTATGLTVRLDWPMLLLAAIGFAVVAFRHARAQSRPVVEAVMPFLVIFALSLSLQLPLARVLYESLPGAEYLQFPWRLLALATPALIVAALYVADAALPNDPRHFVLGGVLMWMVGSCGAFAPLRDPRIQLDPPQLAGVTFSGFREYEPRAAEPLAVTQARLADYWKQAGCGYSSATTADEVTVVRLHIVCERAATLPLPLYASPFHVVKSQQVRTQTCSFVDGFPALCAAIVGAGEDVVSVELPTMAVLFRSAWHRAARVAARVT